MRGLLIIPIIVSILILVTFSNSAFAETTVERIANDSHPPTPDGEVNMDWQLPEVKASCYENGEYSSTCPVLKSDGYTFWAFSYKDNRDGMMIVKYDDSGNVVKKLEKEGARYLYDISVDATEKTVSFWGQADQSIVLSWDELGISSGSTIEPPVIAPVIPPAPEPTTAPAPEPTTAPAPEPTTAPAETEPEGGGGCLIATATFGTEMANQVQLLREIRDNTLLTTASGATFMTGFNHIYYSFSPTIADWERQNPIFKETIKAFITPMISTLSIMQLTEHGSEEQVIGLGISVIALNLGMYVVVPAVAIVKIRSLIRKN